jgi:hypothetical protein
VTGDQTMCWPDRRGKEPMLLRPTTLRVRTWRRCRPTVGNAFPSLRLIMANRGPTFLSLRPRYKGLMHSLPSKRSAGAKPLHPPTTPSLLVGIEALTFRPTMFVSPGGSLLPRMAIQKSPPLRGVGTIGLCLRQTGDGDAPLASVRATSAKQTPEYTTVAVTVRW